MAEISLWPAETCGRPPKAQKLLVAHFAEARSHVFELERLETYGAHVLSSGGPKVAKQFNRCRPVASVVVVRVREDLNLPEILDGYLMLPATPGKWQDAAHSTGVA